jgi:CubicO group peptidase (beta-lactamase class C family)
MQWRNWEMRAATVALGFVLLIPTAHADETLRQCMRRAAERLHFNGIAYAARANDISEEVFGTSDQNGRLPVQHSTKFNIGSAGKMFTAVAIGQMVDRGLIRLDAPIGTYLNGLRPELAAITVTQLLAHTSGLGDYLKPENHELIEKARTATALLPLAIADLPSFAPGSRFAYSNSGYVVLGAIIERISKSTYADYLRQKIFAPAAMNDTALETAGSADPMTRMSPGGLMDKPALSPLRLAFASPAGGEVSTAADMARFLDALQSGRLVTATIRTELFTPQTTRSGEANYGLGFNVTVGPPLKIGHGGGAPGINAEIALFPDSGWKVVMLSNYDPPIASHMASVLERAMFAKDKAAACNAALNDPSLSSALPMHRQP